MTKVEPSFSMVITKTFKKKSVGRTFNFCMQYKIIVWNSFSLKASALRCLFSGPVLLNNEHPADRFIYIVDYSQYLMVS